MGGVCSCLDSDTSGPKKKLIDDKNKKDNSGRKGSGQQKKRFANQESNNEGNRFILNEDL